MDIEDIREALAYNEGSFPRAAVEAAIAQREEMIPLLLETLEDARGNAQELLGDPGYMAHIYAMFLLAQFRERRAYPLVVDLFSLPGEIPEELSGDVITEYLPRILASVSGGDTSLMARLVENEQINMYARSAALEGMVTLVNCGEKTREEVLDYFAGLFRGGLVREPDHIWDTLVLCCTDLYPAELCADIEQAYREELVDSGFVDLEDVSRALDRGKERVLADLRRDRHHQLVRDTVAEIEWWACFQEEAPSEDRLSPIPQQPIQRKQPKVGRNEPCPCGSGKKYKKCCEGKP